MSSIPFDGTSDCVYVKGEVKDFSSFTYVLTPDEIKKLAKDSENKDDA